MFDQEKFWAVQTKDCEGREVPSIPLESIRIEEEPVTLASKNEIMSEEDFINKIKGHAKANTTGKEKFISAPIQGEGERILPLIVVNESEWIKEFHELEDNLAFQDKYKSILHSKDIFEIRNFYKNRQREKRKLGKNFTDQCAKYTDLDQDCLSIIKRFDTFLRNKFLELNKLAIAYPHYAFCSVLSSTELEESEYYEKLRSESAVSVSTQDSAIYYVGGHFSRFKWSNRNEQWSACTMSESTEDHPLKLLKSEDTLSVKAEGGKITEIGYVRRGENKNLPKRNELSKI